MSKIYVMFGLPGAGKGICAQELKIRKGFIHLSLGDYLREQVRQKSKIGIDYQNLVTSGLKLIPCQIAYEIVETTIKNTINSDKNIVIDGFPRTIYQLKLLKAFLSEYNLVAHWIYIKVDPQIGINRLLTREHCINCGYDFIMTTTIIEGICDFCHNTLVKRSTDNINIIRQRNKFFWKTTNKVIQFLKKNDNLIIINSGKNIESMKVKFFDIEKRIT